MLYGGDRLTNLRKSGILQDRPGNQTARSKTETAPPEKRRERKAVLNSAGFREVSENENGNQKKGGRNAGLDLSQKMSGL